MSLSVQRARELLEAVSETRVLVVGDVMLDRYIRGDVHRISPEAPVPVVLVSGEHEVPGGASNVALNIATLGGDCVLAGFIGADADGKSLQALLASRRVQSDGLMEAPDFRTTVKTRIMAERQQVVRIDWDTPLQPSEAVEDAFCRELESRMQLCHAVIVEDYGKGTVSQSVLDRVAARAGELGIPVGIDPKDNRDLAFRNITVATPNRKEAFHAAGIPERRPHENPLEDADLLEVADRLRKQWDTKHLLITLGAQGMLLTGSHEEPIHVSTRAREVFDVSGAGDTVIAVWMSALAAGADRHEASELANAAAGVVVSKLGTATASADEILGVLS